jgi:hypothetical protein
LSETLNAEVYTVGPEGKLVLSVAEEVDFVSYFNGGTHGPPALVAPGRENGQAVPAKARPGQSVLYVNTALVPVVLIERLSE